MKQTLIILSLLLGVQFIFSQPIVLDSTFSEDGKVETSISQWSSLGKSCVVQPDGKVIVAGYHLVNDQTMLARFNSDGSVDPSFNSIQSPFMIHTINLQADGKIVGVTNNSLVRWNSDGSLDQNFNSTPISELSGYDHMEITPLPDGKMLSCGLKLNPNEGFYVARIMPNGSLDSSFAQNGIFKYHGTFADLVFSVKGQSNGKIVVSGCSMLTSQPNIALFGLSANGVLDPGFGVNGIVYDTELGFGEGYNLALQPDGKIIMVGYGHNQDENVACIARYMPDGKRDPSFGEAGAVLIPALQTIIGITLRPNGNILLHGHHTFDHQSAIVQLYPDGKPDLSFGPEGVFYTSLVDSVTSSMAIHFTEPNLITVVNQLTNFQNPYRGITITRYKLSGSSSDVSILADSDLAWSVYPTPTEQHFTLFCSLQNAGKIQLELYDLNGKYCETLLKERYFSTGEHFEPISMSPELSTGNYVLVIIVDGIRVSSLPMIKV